MKVPMDAAGAVTIPAEIRSQLGMDGAGQFELEIIEDTVVLRPTTGTLAEDAWAYTPEHRELLERAHRDSRAGRVQRLKVRWRSHKRTRGAPGMAAVATERRRYTVSEFLALAAKLELAGAQEWFEIVEGELVTYASPDNPHMRAAMA